MAHLKSTKCQKEALFRGLKRFNLHNNERLRSLDLLTGVSDAAHRCLFKTPCACGFGSQRNKKASPRLILDGLISDKETFVLKGAFATCTRCILSRWEVCDCHHIKMKKSNLFAYRIILCLVSLALPLYAKSLGKTLAILPKRLGTQKVNSH